MDLDKLGNYLKFLSTPSARRATHIKENRMKYEIISIHALREEGDLVVRELLLIVSSISIHALREEGDFIPAGDGVAIPAISIHALREEGDHELERGLLRFKLFLSTPSVRRATLLLGADSAIAVFLSTPSVRRATRLCPAVDDRFQISIYALREEGDIKSINKYRRVQIFLSTPSARRATVTQASYTVMLGYFYPRPP